jgi:hypothetical protein
MTMKETRQQKTPEEKEKILKETLSFLEGFVRNGCQGNVSFPCFDGIVGKAKIELFADPLEANKLFRFGGGNSANG